MPLKWICMECNREQPDHELQCVCGNIDPILFEEKDINYEPTVVTMEDKTPSVTSESLTQEDTKEAPKRAPARKGLFRGKRK